MEMSRVAKAYLSNLKRSVLLLLVELMLADKVGRISNNSLQNEIRSV